LTEFSDDELQLRDVIDDSVRRATGLSQRAVTIVAEYPAHLPAAAGDGEELTEIIVELLTSLMGATTKPEIRLRAEIVSSLESPQAREEMPAPSEERPRGLWLLMVITDFDFDSAMPDIPLHDPVPWAALGGGELLRPLTGIAARLQAMSGHIWFQGSPETGNRILLGLPVSGVAYSQADMTQLHRVVGTRISEVDQFSSSILVSVEDELLGRQLSDELSSVGYRVYVAPGIGKVANLAQRGEFDLIILDLQARNPTALEVAMFLKKDQRTQRIPVLFLTAISDSSGGLRIGTADYLVGREGTGAILATVSAALGTGVSATARVMVVEPNDVRREHMIAVLQTQGYPVIEARSAEEALALAERTRVSLVLANVGLAQQRDYWLIRQLKQLPQEIDVFVLEDTMTAEEGERAVSRGADGYSETGKLPDLLDRMKRD
jgi:CheY-like chemotaxis protein